MASVWGGDIESYYVNLLNHISLESFSSSHDQQTELEKVVRPFLTHLNVMIILNIQLFQYAFLISTKKWNIQSKKCTV